MIVENLRCGYGRGDIVKGVSFLLPQNNCLAIIGPNGCGKTTLLRAANGIIPYSGSIRLGGDEVRSLSRTELSRRAALLTQLSAAGFDYTVEDTVMMGRYAVNEFGSSKKGDRELTMELLSEMGLYSIKDARITELSGGQLQRVFLARVFAQEPKTIFLDEPTNHLDIRHSVALTEKLRRWVSEGERRVVGVFHDISLAAEFADMALLLNDGKSVLFGSIGEVLRSDALDEVYEMPLRDYMRRSRDRFL